MADKKELLLFQLGPVQEFIAQAATPADLWAGSYLLSRLVWTGIETVMEKIRDQFGGEEAARKAFVFPCLSDDQHVVETALLKEEKIPTIPNRFLVWVPEGEGGNIAKVVKKNIKAKLDDYGNEVGAAIPGFQEQLDQFLQMTWAVLHNPTGEMGKDYAALGRKLAMRRNVRDFQPWRDVAPSLAEDGSLRLGPKDFLSGKETALDANCKRGAMNMIKEAMPTIENHKVVWTNSKGEHPFPDDYVAVIALDGDKMGKTLSAFETEEQHRNFSRTLVEFAQCVNGIVATEHERKNLQGEAERVDYTGVSIYVGGDDVLAVVPAIHAIPCAKELCDKFSECVKVNGVGKTASCGIAIGHKSVPLQDLVHAAHAAETRAKTNYGRNALALSVFKRSGEILKWGCSLRSDSVALRIYETLAMAKAESEEEKALSARFPYKLAAVLRPYELDKLPKDKVKAMKPVVLEEFRHIWERSTTKEVIADVEKYINETFEAGKPDDFLNLFLCETFITRPR